MDVKMGHHTMIKTILLVLILFLKNGVSMAITDCQYMKGVADCSHKKLTAVPTRLPLSIYYLDISYNDIPILHNLSFESLSNLTVLDIGHNKLQFIEVAAFYGLNHLTDIRLDNNLLEVNKISADVFKNIDSLKKLDIHENICRQSKTVYANVIKHLSNLEEIEMDMITGYVFEKEFQHLKRLNTCILHPVSYDGFYYQDQTFRDLPLSQITSLTTFNVYNIDNDTFRNFTSLHKLRIEFGNNYPRETVDRVFMSLDAFKNRNMTTLEISYNTFENSFRLDNQLKYVQRICLKEFILFHMYITDIYTDAFREFATHSECLETLVITQNTIYNPTIGPFMVLHLCQNLQSFQYDNNNRHLIGRNVSKSFDDITSSFRSKNLLNQPLSLCLPTHLRELSIGDSDMLRGIDGISFTCAKHLTTIVLNVHFHSCSFEVTGMDEVKYLDMSGWDCKRLDWRLVSKLSYLETLIAKTADLGYGIQNNTVASLFLKRNFKLKSVDFSGNSLSNNQHTLFSHKFVNLRFINMSNNNLKNLPDFSFVTKLDTLDLSINAITILTSSDIKTIERIQLSKLFLKGNPLQCSCHSLHFLKWIRDSRTVADVNDIICFLEDGSRAKIAQFVTKLERFKSKCESKFWLQFSVTFSTVILLCVIMGVVYFRFKHAFEYFYLVIKMRFKRYEPLPMECEFDAFVSYSHYDVEWVKQFHDTLEAIGFNLCLDAKNFLPGYSIGENVVKAIDSSRKVIFIVTRNFLDSGWGTYEMEMTRMHAFQKQRNNMVIVVMKDEIDMEKMPPVLKSMWYKIVCIKWPNDATLPFETEDIFYEKLKHSLSS